MNANRIFSVQTNSVINLCRNPVGNDKNDANAHHHNLAVHCRGMANQANMNNLEVGARVIGVQTTKRIATDGAN